MVGTNTETNISVALRELEPRDSVPIDISTSAFGSVRCISSPADFGQRVDGINSPDSIEARHLGNATPKVATVIYTLSSLVLTKERR